MISKNIPIQPTDLARMMFDFIFFPGYKDQGIMLLSGSLGLLLDRGAIYYVIV